MSRQIKFAVGIEAPEDRVEALLKELDGKDISEVVAGGLSKLASVPSGGGVAAGSAPAAGTVFCFFVDCFAFSFGPMRRQRVSSTPNLPCPAQVNLTYLLGIKELEHHKGTSPPWESLLASCLLADNIIIHPCL